MSQLKEFYDSIQSLTPGESITYEGYELEKTDVGGISPPDHSEVGVYNEQGKKIESLSLSAMSYDRFKQVLDEIVAVQPETMEDWLNREK